MKRSQEAVDDVDREIYSLLKGATLRGASNSATKTSVVSLQLSVNIKVESCSGWRSIQKRGRHSREARKIKMVEGTVDAPTAGAGRLKSDLSHIPCRDVSGEKRQGSLP